MLGCGEPVLLLRSSLSFGFGFCIVVWICLVRGLCLFCWRGFVVCIGVLFWCCCLARLWLSVNS